MRERKRGRGYEAVFGLVGWLAVLTGYWPLAKAGSNKSMLQALIIIMGIFRALLVLKKGEMRRRILSRRG